MFVKCSMSKLVDSFTGMSSFHCGMQFQADSTFRMAWHRMAITDVETWPIKKHGDVEHCVRIEISS